MKKLSFLSVAFLLVCALFSVPVHAETSQSGYSNQGQMQQQQPMLNLNTANQADLETLPGVGPKLAQAIIKQRETVGNFKTMDDLDAVPGIAKKRLDAIRSKATV